MAITAPTDITGCVLWLHAGTLSGSHSQGDPVGSWADQSGQGNNGAAAGGDRPLFDNGNGFYHGRPSLLFDGNDDRIDIAAHASLANAAVTYFAVVRMEDMGGQNQWIFNKLNTSAATVALRMAHSGTPGSWEAGCRLSGSTGTFRTAGDSGAAESGFVVLLLRYNGTALELYANGYLAASLSVSGNIDTASNGILSIGNHPTTDTGFGGYIAEMGAYNVAISDTNRDDLIAWLKARYPNSEYSITSSLLSTGNRDCTVRTATKTGEATHQMLVTPTAGNVVHYTSPTNDPHNWTSQGTIITLSGARSTEFIKVGSTWFVYVDDSTTNGIIRLYTGASLASLSQHASSPIITGSAGNYTRSLAVHEDSGAWTMLLDIRTDSLEGRLGHVDRYTSSDGISWTKDTTNSPVISGNGVGGFDKSDISHPHICTLANGTFLVSYSGFNTDEISSGSPHQLGLCTSSDLISFTKVTAKNPIMALGHGGAFDETFHNAPCIWDDGSNLVCYLTGAKTGATIYQLGYATGPSTAAGGVTGTAAQVLPSLTQSTSGSPIVSGSAAQSLSSLTQASAGSPVASGVAAQPLPSLSQAAAGSSIVTGAAAQTLPSLTQSATNESDAGTISQILPSIGQSAAGSSVVDGEVFHSLPSVSQAASGSPVVDGSAAQTLPSISQIAAGPGFVFGSASSLLSGIVQAATGSTKVTGTAAQTLPGFSQLAQEQAAIRPFRFVRGHVHAPGFTKGVIISN